MLPACSQLSLLGSCSQGHRDTKSKPFESCNRNGISCCPTVHIPVYARSNRPVRVADGKRDKGGARLWSFGGIGDTIHTLILQVPKMSGVRRRLLGIGCSPFLPHETTPIHPVFPQAEFVPGQQDDPRHQLVHLCRSLMEGKVHNRPRNTGAGAIVLCKSDGALLVTDALP